MSNGTITDLSSQLASSLTIDSAESYVPTKSLLSDKAILDHIRKGTVLIEPFVMENLSTSSYDVTLGRYYYRESDPEPGMGVYNPYSSAMVNRVWGTPKEAEEAGEWMARTGMVLENISPSDRIIWLKPGETILGHTNEFLGGRRTVTTMMKARSSMGRNFIEVCKCWGPGTKIMMADGTSKKVEDIVKDCKLSIEQLLMGDDSTPRTILPGSAHQGRGSMYRVTSTNPGRDTWTCNEDHILVLKYNVQPYVTNTKKGSLPFKLRWVHLVAGKDAGSQQLAMRNQGFATEAEAEKALVDLHWVPLVFEITIRDFMLMAPAVMRSSCLMFQPELVHFTLPPVWRRLEVLLDMVMGAHVLGTPELAVQTAWVLGMWITDGRADRAEITQIGDDVINPIHGHQPIIDELLRWCRAVYPDESASENAARCVPAGITTSGNKAYHINMGVGLRKLLTEYGMLGAKVIAPELLRESVEVRKALLEGIIDGDGDYTSVNKMLHISNKERGVVDCYIHLARGLGFTTGSVTVKKVVGEDGREFTAHVINIGGPLPTLRPILEYKRCAGMDPSRNPRDDGFTVERIEDGDFYGFTVDGNGRVLLGDFVVSHNCAGWGDVGYVNRWTMEITNNSRYYSIPLVVGRRIAQIVFFDSDGTLSDRSYEHSGKYQKGEDLQKLIASWEPSAMLPQMFKDREIAAGPSHEIHPVLTTPSKNKHAQQ